MYILYVHLINLNYITSIYQIMTKYTHTHIVASGLTDMIATPSMPSHKSDKLPRVERNLELLCRIGWDGINVWWTTSLNKDTTILGQKYQRTNGHKS